MKAVNRFSKKRLIDFLITAKTIQEINQFVKSDFNNATFCHKIKEILPDYHLFTQRDLDGQLIYSLYKPPLKTSLQPKIWHYQRSPHDNCAYLRIQIPDDLPWKKIKIIPIYDVHWGAKGCNEETVHACIDWIAHQNNVFAFIGGDIIELSIANSPGGAIFQQKKLPKQQIKEISEILRPIAHKILWAFPGNHEDRAPKAIGIDPMWAVYQNLEIPYFQPPVYADILWNGKVFTFCTWHGKTGSQTPGGRANAAAQPLRYTEFNMFYIMGHVHDQLKDPGVRICRDRKFDANNKLTQLRLVEKTQLILIAPSFYDYWGTYAAGVYDPPAKGTIGCDLFRDGSYGVKT